MFQYIVRRLLLVIPTVLTVVTLVFFLFRLVPGDTARLIAGEAATEQDLQQIRIQLGLDQPLPVQYVRYLGDLAHGDMGQSMLYHKPVLGEIALRLPATLALSAAAILLAVILGVSTGIISAVKRNTIWDYLAAGLAVGGVAFPNFWLALLLIIAFAVWLRWLPTAGFSGPASLILPAVALAVRLVAIISRLTRSSLLEVIHNDYVRTARAKGLREQRVLWIHAMRNALIPVLTIIGLQLGSLLGGAVVIETIFSWPGIGALMILALRNRDYTMVQGITIVFAILFLIINLITDVAYAWLDPRVQYD